MHTLTRKSETQERILQIKSVLEEIDVRTARPARAIISALVQNKTPDPTDVEYITVSEARAQDLRLQLEAKFNLLALLESE